MKKNSFSYQKKQKLFGFGKKKVSEKKKNPQILVEDLYHE